MTAPLHIGLPVALHNDGEIAAFQEARERIPALLRGYGIESTVSAFLFYTRPLLKPERRERQLENQARLRLPIIHAQTPVYSEDSLACDEQEQAAFGTHSLLETTVEHTAALKALDPSGIPCTVDTHAGVFVYDALEPAGPAAGIYGAEEFSSRALELFMRVKSRFRSLKNLAQKGGLGMLLENAPPAVYMPDRRDGVPRMHYLPFTQFGAWSILGDGGYTCDIAHWAAAKHLPMQFKQNGIDPTTLFRSLLVQDWDQYDAVIGDLQSFTRRAKAIHMSNTNGIGVHLENLPEIAQQWGDWGVNDGLLSRETLRTCLLDAQAKGVPVMIEVDYDVKNIPRNKYAEADSFLTHILHG